MDAKSDADGPGARARPLVNLGAIADSLRHKVVVIPQAVDVLEAFATSETTGMTSASLRLKLGLIEQGQGQGQGQEHGQEHGQGLACVSTARDAAHSDSESIYAEISSKPPSSPDPDYESGPGPGPGPGPLLCLLPAGLRAVKDPEYLIGAVQAHNRRLQL